MENKAFGIDLGTTYSCISYVDDISGEPVVVDNSEGTNVTPSIVCFEDEDTIVVGNVAKETEEALDTKIKDVVITCPAYFGIAEKTATENAGKMAGLNVLEIINEPTAAALCYGSLRDVEDKTILVYDLGGGTFDVTIIRVTPEEIVAIATDGDHQLGGKDWDTAVMNCVEEVFRDQKSFDDEFDLEAQQDLRLRAEKAKQQLTGRPKTKVIVQASGAKANIEFTRDEFDEITSALLSQTLDKTKAAIEAAEKKGVTKIDEIILVGGSCKMPAKGAALHAEALSKGHVELQKWRDELKEAVENLNKDRAQEDKIDIDTLTEDTISKEDMEAIKKEVEKNGGDAQKVKFAIGGKAREGGKQGPVLRNITSKSFGVQIVRDEMVDGKMEMVYKIANLIQKQDAVPVTVTQEFGTAYANMENAEIVVFETEVTEEVYDVGSNRVLGAAVLNLPPNLPEGAPIQITFSLSTDGLLSMKGVDMTSNQEVKTILKTDSILTEEDVAAQTQALKGIRLN